MSPSVSKKQRRFFGLVRGLQKGDTKTASLGAQKVAREISPSDAKDFAKTKEKGLRLRKRVGERKQT